QQAFGVASDGSAADHRRPRVVGAARRRLWNAASMMISALLTMCPFRLWFSAFHAPSTRARPRREAETFLTSATIQLKGVFLVNDDRTCAGGSGGRRPQSMIG